MVEEGSWAWIQINQSNLFRHPIPGHIVVSAFANREIYLVVANYGKSQVELETAAPFVPCQEPLSEARTHLQLRARSLLLLKLQKKS